MQFGRVANIQLLSTLAGIAIAVVVAIYGFGYWALVLRPIVMCVAVGAWVVCRWRPGFPAFDNEVKPLVRFGLHVVGFSVIYTMAKALDRIALGLFYRPDQVGYYQNATALYENSIFSALVQAHVVASAALSKLQSNPAALRQRYEAALSALAFFFMPMAAILSVVAEDLTVILLGEKWRAAGSLLSIIALRGIFQVVEGSQGWLHLSVGRADRWRNWGIVTAAVQIVAVLGGLPFGAKGRRHGSGHDKLAHCRTLDNLCGPPDRHWRCTRNPGRAPATDRRNQRRGWRLVAANHDSDRLFQPCAYLLIGQLQYPYLPRDSCRPVSA